MTTGDAAPARAGKLRSYWTSVGVYLEARSIAIFALGFSAGLPFLLVFSTLSAWLRDVDVSRSTIGVFSWVGLLFSIKVLWAPIVDRCRLPLPLGQRRNWLIVAQVTIVAGILGLAATDPSTHLVQVALFALLVAFGSATQDITIDAFRIEAGPDDVQGVLAAAYIFGYRLALLVAGGGALWFADLYDWPTSYSVMAGLMSVGIVTTLLVREPIARAAAPSPEPRADRLRRFLNEAVMQPFLEFWRRHRYTALLLLALIGCYRISDLTMGIMANPFYIDLGFTKSEIAGVVKSFGFAMTMLGSFLGGALVVRFGVPRMLLVGAVAVAATNLLFASLAEVGPSLEFLTVVIIADNLSGGFASVVFVAFLSSLVNRSYTATQYALFSSFMTLPGKFLGGSSGFIVDATDYTTFFVYAAVMGLPAIVLTLLVMRRDEFRDRDANETS